MNNNDDRIDKLENSLRELRNDMTEVRVDVGMIKGQLSHFATHADIAKILMWLFGLGFSSLIGIVIGVLNFMK